MRVSLPGFAEVRTCGRGFGYAPLRGGYRPASKHLRGGTNGCGISLAQLRYHPSGTIRRVEGS
jgi:hypothetical protein